MDENKKNENEHFFFDMFLVTTERNNKPCIELRKVITNPELMKLLISSAYHHKTIEIMPTFSCEFRALTQLMNKGILEYDCEEGIYKFKI